MEKTVVELFAGVGGFRCGLNNVTLINDKVKENGNWKFVWANQWEPLTKSQDAYDCYTLRFGKEDVSNVDIFEVETFNRIFLGVNKYLSKLPLVIYSGILNIPANNEAIIP